MMESNKMDDAFDGPIDFFSESITIESSANE